MITLVGPRATGGWAAAYEPLRTCCAKRERLSKRAPTRCFLFETVAASAPCRDHQPPFTLGGVVQTGPVEMAVYSLTGNARSPFHAEPAHYLVSFIIVLGKDGLVWQRNVAVHLVNHGISPRSGHREVFNGHFDIRCFAGVP